MEIRNILEEIKSRDFNQMTNADMMNFLDMVYIIYTGEKHSSVYSSFTTPGGRMLGSTKPVAWYQSNYDLPGSCPDAPIVGVSGYIPDAINRVIFSEEYSPTNKMKQLDMLFLDLRTIALRTVNEAA